MKRVFSSSRTKKIILLLILLITTSLIRRSTGEIREDNYVGYAQDFSNNLENLSFYDNRLYPGFPILIYIVNFFARNTVISSYIIIYSSLIFSYLLLNRITKRPDNMFIFLFPPIMLDVATKIANEYLTILLILSFIYYFNKKKYKYSSLIAALGLWVRPVITLLFPAMIASLYISKRTKVITKLLIPFIVPVIFFMVFNYIFFNSPSPFYQLFIYKEVSPYGNAVGFTQVFIDLYRAFHWRQYNIFLSGLFYLCIFVYGLVNIWKSRTKYKSTNEIFLVLSIILITFYIFTYTFNPFLENLARYSVSIFFLMWILFRDKIKIPIYLYSLITISIIITLV